MTMKSESIKRNIRSCFIDIGDFKMIKYEDIIKRIANIEKKKIKNEERIKLLSEENNTLNSNLKILNQKKEMLEKMDQDLADLIPDKKKAVAN